MDFKLAYQDGRADMTWDPVDTIANNVWLSLNIRQGALFTAPRFGNRFHLLKKNTALAPALAEELAREALDWLIDTGRAVLIEVAAERDAFNQPDRLLLRGTVVQADGRRVPFEQFVEVV